MEGVSGTGHAGPGVTHPSLPGCRARRAAERSCGAASPPILCLLLKAQWTFFACAAALHALYSSKMRKSNAGRPPLRCAALRLGAARVGCGVRLLDLGPWTCLAHGKCRACHFCLFTERGQRGCTDFARVWVFSALLARRCESWTCTTSLRASLWPVHLAEDLLACWPGERACSICKPSSRSAWEAS